MLRIKPEEERGVSQFEQLFCELVNSGYAVQLEEGGSEMGIFLEDFYFKIQASGKWRIE